MRNKQLKKVVIVFQRKGIKMKIEVLFPEYCNLFGDIQNINYLSQCLPEAEVVNTYIDEEPRFVNEKIDLIYLGPMTEKTQAKVINKLMKYKEKIEELINDNVVFLFTGNALEILGKYIENEDGSKIEALGIFDIYAKRDMMNRFNCFMLGKLEDFEIVGFKSTFSLSYGNNEENFFIKTEKGIGLNKETKLEGIRKNNFIGTYIIGPILIINPLFTKYVMKLMGVEEPTLKFENAIMEAYSERLWDFKNKI